jgi:K+-transporting ATPase ATPase B chain
VNHGSGAVAPVSTIMPVRPIAASTDWRFVRQVAKLALQGLNPRSSVRRPVLLALELTAVAATILCAVKLWHSAPAQALFMGQVALWLWLTLLVISAGVATVEAGTLARSRRLRALQSDLPAKVLIMPHDSREDWLYETVASETLEAGDVVLVRAGDVIPADGEVIAGAAEVDESAITGESAPVIRESGGDRSAVIGGTRVLSDWLKVKVTADVGHGMLAQVSELIAGARRRSVRSELWLTLPLLALAVLAVLGVALLHPTAGTGLDLVVLLIAMFGAMLPTATAGLRSMVGIVGMARLVAAKMIAKSGAAVEATGGVDTLLLDKTGTITLGERRVETILPLPGIGERDAAEVAWLASLGDETPEGRSIATFAAGLCMPQPAPTMTSLPFSAATRMSGATLSDGTELRKGEPAAILRHLGTAGGRSLQATIERIAGMGGTPLLLSRGNTVIGVVHLHDAIRPGMRAQCQELRRLGVRTVMVTGDNRVTAATVAAEAGVDDFVAEASPDDKLKLVRREQAEGRRVGMCGDGANDAPALAQAELGIALGHGAAAAREAGNMIDLSGDPTKLIQVIRGSRRLAAAGRSLTGLALGADLAKVVLLALAVFAWPEPPAATLLAGCIFGAAAVLVLIPQLRRAAVRPRNAEGWVGVVSYGLIGMAASPLAILLLQGTVRAFGLA